MGGRAAFNKYKKASQSARRYFFQGKEIEVCNMCDHTFPIEELTIDHIVQVALGGTNEIGNLQVLCRPCHIAKDVDVYKRIPTYA